MAIKASCASAPFVQPSTAETVQMESKQQQQHDKRCRPFVSVCVFCPLPWYLNNKMSHEWTSLFDWAMGTYARRVVVSNFQHIFARFLRFDYCFIITFSVVLLHAHSLTLSLSPYLAFSLMLVFTITLSSSSIFVLFCSSSFSIRSNESFSPFHHLSLVMHTTANFDSENSIVHSEIRR